MVPARPPAAVHRGARATTPEHAAVVLFSLDHVRKNRELYLDIDQKRRRDCQGRRRPDQRLGRSAGQRRKADAADAIDELMRQGLELHRATSAFKAGDIDVADRDYVVRGDQLVPPRSAEMSFTVQEDSPPQNPRPYNDTGSTFQFMRNIPVDRR